MGERLTASDVKKIEEEIEYRRLVERKRILNDVKEARAQGDLSENFEYYAAKKEKNRNDGRIRYLEKMLKYATIVDDTSKDDEVGMNNTVDVYFEDDDETETYKLVTSIRGDSMHNYISIESPIGKAIMGHKVGWLPLYAGIAGGADVILLPEIPYDIDKIAKTLDNRIANGKKFSILAVAEGALSKEEAAMKKKDFKKARAEMKYPSIVYRLADELASRVDNEIRVCVPGHFQRGGSPCAYDRVLSTRFGAAAAMLIREKNYGNMVGLVNGKIVPVPLSEVAGKLKTVPVDCEEILAAREIGISFGD